MAVRNRSDIVQQLASYKGILRWNGYVDGQGVTRPAIDVELYIKEHPIPIRKPKVTEIVTANTIDPYSGREAHSEYLFYGAPDVLQIALSGWIITPTAVSNTRTSGNAYWATTGWAPKAADGSDITSTVGNIPYGELVSAFLEGRMNPSINGGSQRKDPDSYISPYGNEYAKPVISLWECTFTTNMRKQQFNATLLLEK